MNRDTARQQIAELAQKYASQTDVYEQADYNEAQTKEPMRNLIDIYMFEVAKAEGGAA